METQKIDGYQWLCPRCQKQIISVNEMQFTFNKAVHEKVCKSTAEAIVNELKTRKKYEDKRKEKK